MLGVGYQHAGLCLSFNGAQRQYQGVFIKSSRSPILTMDTAVQGPYPPTLREFTQSGRLLSDPAHSLAAISDGVSPSRNDALNPERLRGIQAQTLASQNSADLFQSKQFLMDHHKTPQMMLESFKERSRAVKQLSPVAVRSIKSISTRKKSVFK